MRPRCGTITSAPTASTATAASTAASLPRGGAPELLSDHGEVHGELPRGDGLCSRELHLPVREPKIILDPSYEPSRGGDGAPPEGQESCRFCRPEVMPEPDHVAGSWGDQPSNVKRRQGGNPAAETNAGDQEAL